MEDRSRSSKAPIVGLPFCFQLAILEIWDKSIIFCQNLLAESFVDQATLS